MTISPQLERAIRKIANDHGLDKLTIDQIGIIARALIDYMVLRMHDQESQDWARRTDEYLKPFQPRAGAQS